MKILLRRHRRNHSRRLDAFAPARLPDPTDLGVYVDAVPGSGSVVLLDGRLESVPAGDAERWAFATLAACMVAGHRPAHRYAQHALPGPDPIADDSGCVWFGEGVAAVFPGDGEVRVHVAGGDGEPISAARAEVWALSLLAACRISRAGRAS